MALFPWSKNKGDGGSDDAKGGGGGGKSGGGDSNPGEFEFSGDKANKFFDRGQTLHDATNFGYAMNMWIRGLRFDPTSMRGLEGFFTSSASFFSEHPKGEKEETFKSTLKDVGGRSTIDKFLTALMHWSSHPTDPSYGVRAMEHASELGLGGPAVWVAERVVSLAMKDKSPRKEHYVAAMETFKKFDKFERAVQAGEAAVRMDPTDGRLASEIKNLSAEWTTKRGGFEDTGKEGGFRSNIRDADKQKQLEEKDRLTTTEEGLDRQVASATADYEVNTNDRPNAIKLIDVLLKRARTDDEERAVKIANEWHAKSKEYRFREYVDNIRVRQLRRKAAKLKGEAEKSADAEVKQAYTQAVKEYLKAEIVSLEGQVEAYPTDLNRKFELAQRYYKVGKHEEAIPLLQEAKQDVKTRARVLFFLGLAFQKIGYTDEAIDTIRQARQSLIAGDESAEMELSYGLMEALLARAQEQSTLGDAEEAGKLQSAIAIQNINYRDVKAKREEIKALIAKLKSGSAGGATS